jgi:hypothetical protein
MSGRILKATLVCVTTLVVAPLFGVCPAGAAFLTPEYGTTFTGGGDHQIGEAIAVAADEQTHDVYVADRSNHRIEKFAADGTFLFMLGDGVNETTGGDVCPVSPGDVCRVGQQASTAFPHFTNPSAISVDNSGGPSKGSVYVAEGTFGGGDSTIWRFGDDGVLDTSWGSNGGLFHPDLARMTVSPFDGTIWVLDSDVADIPGGVDGSRVVAYGPDGFRKLRIAQTARPDPDGNLAVDDKEDLWFSSNGTALKVDLDRLGPPFGSPLGQISPGQAGSFAVDPLDNDILAVFNEEEVKVFEQSCEPTLGYCTPKESFGNGHLAEPKGLAYDGSAGSVYVAGSAGVVVFHSLKVPDVTVNAPSVRPTEAVLSAHVDPIGAGDIVTCQVEFGTTKTYGTTIPCDQPLPIAAAGEVTAHALGLTTEATYHYRFRVGNGNGADLGRDQVLVPHWVSGLETGDASDVGPGSATLHGQLNPEGEATHYYFEWGTTTAYGHRTPDLPGASTSAAGLTEIETTIAGELTSSTTYHYRLVGTNDLGTSHGFDRVFTTPLSEPPQLRRPAATATGLTTATLGAEINPGFGSTAFKVQYGTTASYARQTVVSDPIADDGQFHFASVAVSGLVPGTTYHFRVIAFNFVGYVATQDATFTTPDLPSIQSVTAEVIDPHTVRLSAVVGDGLRSPAGVRFEYGPTGAYGSLAGTASVAGPSSVASVVLSRLAPATTYHFRVSASNDLGSVTSADSAFTTPSEPAPRRGGPTRKCKKGFVKKKRRCVRKHSHRKTKNGTGR